MPTASSSSIHGRFPPDSLTIEEVSTLGEVMVAERAGPGLDAVLRIDPSMMALISAHRGRGELTVAGRDRGAVDDVGEAIVASLRDADLDEDQVPITFWALASPPFAVRRRITAPAWSDVRHNYAKAAQAALDELMAATRPGPGGLLLWHGEPGTGKSYALRALAREWRGWCDTHFITDSEAFLGTSASYLMHALLSGDRGPGGKERWRLVVLEDAGELLAADARAVAGQAVSRLLNLTDGLLGVGLRAIVLVTTNEPLRRLHPAVVRPGRTWADVEFTALSAGEAAAWLERQGASSNGVGPAPLAELFAAVDGRHVPAQSSVGFAA